MVEVEAEQKGEGQKTVERDAEQKREGQKMVEGEEQMPLCVQILLALRNLEKISCCI